MEATLALVDGTNCLSNNLWLAHVGIARKNWVLGDLFILDEAPGCFHFLSSESALCGHSGRAHWSSRALPEEGPRLSREFFVSVSGSR